MQKCRFVSSETIYFPLPEIKSFSICQTEIFKTLVNLKSYMSARQALHTKENKNDNCIFITQSIIYIDFFVHQIEMMFFFHYFCSKCKINDFYKEMREHFYSQDVYCGVLNGLLRSHKTHRLLLPQRKKTIM